MSVQRRKKTVRTPTAALWELGLPKNKKVVDLSVREMKAFRKLVGWESGGLVVAYPTEAEGRARKKREEWKSRFAGKGNDEPCLLIDPENVKVCKRNVRRDRSTAAWFRNFMRLAEAVADLPLATFEQLVPEQPPTSVAGSFCPNCVGKKSDISLHRLFWRWSVYDPEKITCPYCGITYPHPDFPEEGRLELPRLGLTYSFYLSPEEKAAADWRDGAHASRFAGAPTHVSFSGETRRCQLSWVMGQVEPLAIAYAVTGDEKYARIVQTILTRLAEVYARYPLYSYMQDYVDADPAYAIDNIDRLPTAFKKSAFWFSYTGQGFWLSDTGQVGPVGGLYGMDSTTTSITTTTSGEFGATRIAREKTSNGETFLTLFKAYDLIKDTIAPEARKQLEQDLLLEFYLDVKGMSRNIDNKSGPGTAARVAVGVFYNDQRETEEGLEQFHRTLESLFYPDGSWKQTPIYGAKPLFENMAEVPEMLRGRVDLYADPIYRQALATFGEAATPLGTQPALGDCTVDYSLQADLVDIARVRLGVSVPRRPNSLEGFNLINPHEKMHHNGEVPGLNCLALSEKEGRYFSDGPIGFPTLGQIPRKITTKRSVFSMFNESLPPPQTRARFALNRYYQDRGLICLGFGRGAKAIQLYCVGDDGAGGHRHQDPLSVLLFAGGREIFPDLGYICDHPANAWVHHTASHNAVMVDEHPVRSTDHCVLNGFVDGGRFRFFDVTVPVSDPKDATRTAVLRRAMVLLRKKDGLPILVDVFDVTGGRVHDYLVRVNDRDRSFATPGLSFKRRRKKAYQGIATPPFDFRTAGRAHKPFSVYWGKSLRVAAHVLTPCDEVFTFKSPAWRSQEEVFKDPNWSWDALDLRMKVGCSRFVVVYEVFDGPKPHVTGVEMERLHPEVVLDLATDADTFAATIGDGCCQVRKGNRTR